MGSLAKCDCAPVNPPLVLLPLADEMDIDAQRKLEELIAQRNIDENLEAAMENAPEVFGQVRGQLVGRTGRGAGSGQRKGGGGVLFAIAVEGLGAAAGAAWCYSFFSRRCPCGTAAGLHAVRGHGDQWAACQGIH